jgi:hypothetical protein
MKDTPRVGRNIWGVELRDATPNLWRCQLLEGRRSDTTDLARFDVRIVAGMQPAHRTLDLR